MIFLLLAIHVIDDMSLGSVWREHLYFGTEAGQSNKHCNGLRALGAIVDPIAVENDGRAEISTSHTDKVWGRRAFVKDSIEKILSLAR